MEEIDSRRGSKSDEEPVTTGIGRILSETIVPVVELARELDRDAATLARWCTKGTLQASSEGRKRRTRLEHFRAGGSLFTSREAFARYVIAMTAPEKVAIVTPSQSGRKPARRRRVGTVAADQRKPLGC